MSISIKSIKSDGLKNGGIQCKRDTLMQLVDERPKRKCAEGQIIVHFDRSGQIRKIEDVVPYQFK